ncbi:hypothetical protein Mgra_00009156 [Meloidogyne graminicola]|uniref:Uncharacterized protein n=1 Tax=Meloidogyne graminicola TaxID=189291 RepID=A0A8S9ZDP3_9BILA|nr:hypothetical protein Mgra_00009156 [Meloidogyne graminicola]
MNNIYSSQPISIKHYDAEDKQLSEEKIEIIFEVRKNEIGNLGIYISKEIYSCISEDNIYNINNFPSNNGISRIKITEKRNENMYEEELNICLDSIQKPFFIEISPSFNDKIEYERSEQTYNENTEHIKTIIDGIPSKIFLESWDILADSTVQDPKLKLTNLYFYYKKSINNNAKEIGSSKGKEIFKENINLDYVELYFYHGKFLIYFPSYVSKSLETIIDDEIKGNKQTKQLYLNKITKQITKEEMASLKNMNTGVTIYFENIDLNDDNKDVVRFVDSLNLYELTEETDYESIGKIQPLFNNYFKYEDIEGDIKKECFLKL